MASLQWLSVWPRPLPDVQPQAPPPGLPVLPPVAELHPDRPRPLLVQEPEDQLGGRHVDQVQGPEAGPPQGPEAAPELSLRARDRDRDRDRDRERERERETETETETDSKLGPPSSRNR